MKSQAKTLRKARSQEVMAPKKFALGLASTYQRACPSMRASTTAFQPHGARGTIPLDLDTHDLAASISDTMSTATPATAYDEEMTSGEAFVPSAAMLQRKLLKYADPSRTVKEAIFYVDSARKAAKPKPDETFEAQRAHGDIPRQHFMLHGSAKLAAATDLKDALLGKSVSCSALSGDGSARTRSNAFSTRPPWINPQGLTRATNETKLRKPKTCVPPAESATLASPVLESAFAHDSMLSDTIQAYDSLNKQLQGKLDALEVKHQSMHEEIEKELLEKEEIIETYKREYHLAQEKIRIAEASAEQWMGTSRRNAEEISTLREELEKLKKLSKKTEDNLRAELQAKQDAHKHENMMLKVAGEKSLKEAKKQQSDTKKYMASKDEVAQGKIAELTASLQSVTQKLSLTKQAHQREERARYRLEHSHDRVKEESLKSLAESQRVAGQLEMAELKLRVSEKMCRKYEEDALANAPEAVALEQEHWREDLRCEIADCKQQLAEEKDRSKVYVVDAQEAADTLQRLLKMLKEVVFQRDQYALNLNTAEETMRMTLLTQRHVQAHFRESRVHM